MEKYCCTRFDDNGNLLYSVCFVNLHCPPGWMETPVNECTACPTSPSNQSDTVNAIEQDSPGSSQYAEF